MTNPIAPTFVNPLDTNMSPTTYPGVLPIGPFQTNTPDVRESITAATQERAAPIPTPAAPPTPAQATPSAPITISPPNPIRGINTTGNPLNAFANYTYHIRFSMVNETQAYNSVGPDTDLSSLNRYIIAESGATAAFNISRFSFVNTVSPGFKNQNQNLLTWRMTINEPYGLTLPDYILNAARSGRIGIRNSHRFPFFIELWFTGYDEAGNILEPSVTRRTWRVMMLDFDLETTVTGTTYNLHGTADNAIGTANQYAFPPTSLQLTGLTTFGDAVNKLQEALNKAAKEAENRNAATTYVIEIPNELRSWRMVDARADTQTGTGRDTAGRGATSFPINRGQDLGNFMLTLASKCGEDADKFLRGVQGNSAASSADTRGLGRVLQVFTEVKLGEYVPDLNDYKKTITLRMVPFYTPRIVSTPADAKKQLDKAVQERKLTDLQSLGLLAKQYDYQYTGLNTEILRFDVKVENFWAITLPTYLGTSTWSQNHVGPVFDRTSTGATFNRQTAIRFNNDNILPSPAADIANRIPTNITSGFGSLGSIASSFGVGSAASPFGNMGSAGGVFGALSSSASSGMNNSIQGLAANNIGNFGGGQAQSQLIRGLASVINAGIPRFDAQTTGIVQNIANTIQRTGALSNAAAVANGALLQSLADSTRGLTYLEDVKSQIDASNATLTDALRVAFQVDPAPMSQNAINNANERKLQTPTVGGFPIGQTMFGQTIGNLYDQKFMLQIDLTIRGDPYWMGNSNLQDNELSKTLLNLANQGNLQGIGAIMRDRANYLVGENMFLLRFRTGTNYREDTGFMDFERSSDYFNGIYAVLEVENKFENGSFTQDLKAYKELFSQKTSRDLTSGAGAPAPPAGGNNVPAPPPATAPTTATPNTGLAIGSAGPIPIGENGPIFF